MVFQPLLRIVKCTIDFTAKYVTCKVSESKRIALELITMMVIYLRITLDKTIVSYCQNSSVFQ